MNETLEQRRILAYRAADDGTKVLYGNPIIGEIIASACANQKIESEVQKTAVDIVGDIILGFYPKSDSVKLLVQNALIPQETAEKIAKELIGFFDPQEKKPELPTATPDPRERLFLRPEGVDGNALPEKHTEEMAKPLTRDTLMDSLVTHRTMAGDIEAARKKSGASENTPPANTAKAELPQHKEPKTLSWEKKT